MAILEQFSKSFSGSALWRTAKRIVCCAALCGFLSLSQSSLAGVRIKDITHVQGDRINQLSGLGLVTGLNGTGGKSPITRQFALNFEQRMGIRADPATRAAVDFATNRKTNNLSVVVVTANLPSFARDGSQMDVVVSAYDDAKSLLGGVLVRTALYGVDGEVYAVASGPVSVGGFSFGGQAAQVQQNHPTSGRIPMGATIEKETCTQLETNGTLSLVLNSPDHATASRIALKINEVSPNSARTIDSATVQTLVPTAYQNRIPEWVSWIGHLEVEPDTPARVVINERTGTVVIGENVRISRVLITHSNLTITTAETPEVSQPAPFSQGETTTVPRTQIGVTQDGLPITEFTPNLTVGDLAMALNTLGVAPRDLSSIFQQLKESGALHADLQLK